MRILIVTDAWHPQVNGVVTTLQNTIRLLQEDGNEVIVAHPGNFTSFPCPGYPEIRLSLFPKDNLKQFLIAYEPDCVHIATEGPLGLAMRKILRKRGEQWSSSFHTKFAEYVEHRLGWGANLVWRWLRHVYKHDAKVLVTTETMRNELILKGFSPPARLIVWGRGVDEKVFNTNGKTRAVQPDDVMVNVGRVSVEKNLEAFYESKVPGRKIQVGDGPMLDVYRARYPEVEFVGAKFGHELADYYRMADAMVFPSKSDTFGLVMIEAMRCGTPVAAYPVTGPIDIIENGQNGFMDENIDVAIENALLLNYRTVEKASRQFTWENATQQFKKALVRRK